MRHDAAGLWLFTDRRSALREIASELLPGLCAADHTILLQTAGHHGEPVNVGDIGERDTQIGKAAERSGARIGARHPPSSARERAAEYISEAVVAPLSFALAGVTILADWLGPLR